MSAGLLEGLPDLLHVLSSVPHPDEVAEAIVTGPGRQFGAVSGAVLWARNDQLIMLGLHGYLPEEVRDLDALPIGATYPLVQAFHEGEVFTEPIATAATTHPALSRPTGRWQHTVSRFPHGSIISAPIVSRGRAVGAFGLTCTQDRPWTVLESALLDAVSSALGLWMAHPDSGLASDADARVSDVRLSERQRRILVLVETGRTNTAIAAALGCSASTVKQELRRIQVLLDAPDRLASAQRARSLGLLSDAP